MIVSGAFGLIGIEERYIKSVYKASESKPSRPSSVISPSGWSSIPPSVNSGSFSGEFVDEGDGWYRSPSGMGASSEAISRFSFTTTADNQSVYVSIVVSSESNYDFGYVSKLDSEYTDYTAKVSGEDSQEFTISVPTAGAHFIEFAYTKDVSNDSGEDCFRVKVTTSFDTSSKVSIWCSQAEVYEGIDTVNWSDPVKWNGTDGVSIENVYRYYLATSLSSGITIETSGWTSTTQTMTSEKKYLWSYEKIIFSDGRESTTTPSIIGVYGDKGDQGDPGQDGADGTDGKGYEYCYNYTTVNVRPETPTSSVNDNVTPAGWYTYPPSISASRPYIWECQRVKSNGVWSAWSIPTLKNRWAYDGVDGANGDKGAKMRMRTWESGVRYLQGAEGEEFYDIVVYETKLYLCTKTHTSSSSNNPIESIGSYLGYWESAQQWTFIATQLLLAGKIVSDKITADLIDADGITAKDVDISGKITATSGDIGGFAVDSNSLICKDGNARLQIEVSGERFFRLNSPAETAFMRLRADNSVCVDVTAFGTSDEAVALRLLCNSRGYGKAIDATGNVRLIARPDEWIIINGLSLNSRTVTSSANIQTNDDIIIANNSNDITLYLSDATSPGKMIYIKRKGTGKVTVKGNIINQDVNTIVTSLDITDYPPRLFFCHGAIWFEFSGRH